MLQRSSEHRPALYREPLEPAIAAQPAFGFEHALLTGALHSLRRNARLIVMCLLIGTTLALTAALSITPQFKASVTVFVDPRRTQLLKDRDVVGVPGPGTDNGVVESEAEVMRSPALMLDVVRKLDLVNDAEFAGGSIFSTIKAILLWPIRLLSASQGEVDPAFAVAERLSGQIETKRRALTYLIELNAWSLSPHKARKLADTVVDVYLGRQMAAKGEIARRASRWLNEQVEELRNRVTASERAYEQYKAESGLFRERGENLSDRQVAQLNEQLINARARAAEARAKLNQLSQITPDKLQSAAASPEVLQSSVIANLRAQYADFGRRHAELTARYGALHPQVGIVQAQRGDIAGHITAEIGRIVASARAEYEMASSREKSLEASLNELKRDTGRQDQAMVRLHELEREAQANRELFQAFLSRAKEATAQIDMQLPDARVVSAASVPVAPSYPRRTLIVALGAFVACGFGIVLALVRDTLSTGFRKAEDIETTFGLFPLASVPLVESPRRWRSLHAAPLLGELRALHRAELAAPADAAHDRNGAATRRLARLALDQPDSPFAESIRSLLFSLKHAAPERAMTIVLVTSALPGEGKSTVAVNLARMAAVAHDRTLLIDSDLRRPNLATAFDIPGSTGLADLLTHNRDLSGTLHRDARTGLHVMAGTTRLSGAEALSLLASQEMGKVLAVVRRHFDLVVLDAPPLVTVTDSRALIELVDGVVMVVASEETSREAIATALRESPGIEEKLIGVVLNKAAGDPDHRYHEVAPEAAA